MDGVIYFLKTAEHGLQRARDLGPALTTSAKGARTPPPPIRLLPGKEEGFQQRRRNICGCQRPMAVKLCTGEVCLGAAICLASSEQGSSL